MSKDAARKKVRYHSDLAYKEKILARNKEFSRNNPRVRSSTYMAEYYRKMKMEDPEKYKAKKKKDTDNHRRRYHADADYRERTRVSGMASYQRNKEKRRQEARDHSKKLRVQVFAAYGNKCTCCGESAYEFLTLDHVNGNGREHRRQVGKGIAVYQDVIRRGFPADFQVLCYNCNCAKRTDAECPHQRSKERV